MGDDHVAGQLAAVLFAHGLHRRAHLLGGEPRAQLVDQRARDAHGGVGGLLRAPDAGELELVLDPAAALELVVVDRQLDAVRAQVVGDEQRELRRDGRLGDAQRVRGAQADLGVQVHVVETRGDQVVLAERGRIDDLDAVRGDLRGVEHGDRRGAAAVVLQVQERITDPGGDLVEERRRVLRRSVDQDGDAITSRRASTVGTWRT